MKHLKVGDIACLIKQWDSYPAGTTVIVSDVLDYYHGDDRIHYKYSVINYDTGVGFAWVYDDAVKYISEGGDAAFEHCRRMEEFTTKRNEDINYIKSRVLNNESLSAQSILKLFHEIDHFSSFEQNGEYLRLFDDWKALRPIFIAAFNKDYNAMIGGLDVFSPRYRDEYKEKAVVFYNKINNIHIKEDEDADN